MHPLVRNELVATGCGLLGLGVSLWLQTPLTGVVVVTIGAYTGAKLLLPMQKLLPTSLRPVPNVRQLSVDFFVVLGQLAQQLPNLDSQALMQVLHENLKLGQQIASSLEEGQDARSDIAEVVATFQRLRDVLSAYLKLSTRIVLDEELAILQDDFKEILEKLRTFLQLYHQQGVRMDWDTLQHDLQKFEKILQELPGRDTVA